MACGFLELNLEGVDVNAACREALTAAADVNRMLLVTGVSPPIKPNTPRSFSDKETNIVHSENFKQEPATMSRKQMGKKWKRWKKVSKPPPPPPPHTHCHVLLVQTWFSGTGVCPHLL